MADQRIQYSEEQVGANHATKTDTLNRLTLVDHNNDGTHKSILHPYFAAHRNGVNHTGFAASTWTRISLTTEEADSHGYFDSTTNYRFLPLVAGWYSFNGAVPFLGIAAGYAAQAALYKNGTPMRGNTIQNISTTTRDLYIPISGQFYLGGASDYVELWCYHNDTVPRDVFGNTVYLYLNGCKIS